VALNNVLMRLTKFELHTCRRQRTAFIKCSKINNKQPTSQQHGSERAYFRTRIV